MNEMNKKSVDEFLDDVAARQPTPGGGAVAATAGALATVMVRMVAAYSINKKTPADKAEVVERIAGELAHADSLLRALIEQDMRAYERVRQVQAQIKDGSGNQDQYQEVVLAATAVPMQIAALVVATLKGMDELKSVASRYLISDLGVAVVLAQATVRAAHYCVWVNLNELTDADKRCRITKEIEALVSSAVSLSQSIEAFVRTSLENDGKDSR